MYARVGRGAQALNAAKQATRYAEHNFKVWDNLIAIALQCGKLGDVVFAMHRLLDLRRGSGGGNKVDVGAFAQLIKASVADAAKTAEDHVREDKERIAATFHSGDPTVIHHAKRGAGR